MISTINSYTHSQELATKARIKTILTKAMKDYNDVQKFYIYQIGVKERKNKLICNNRNIICRVRNRRKFKELPHRVV